MRTASSKWSLWSERSLLSIASRGSVLSIGSVGSALSIGSIMSFRARRAVMKGGHSPARVDV
jgi:hypothetical protein